MIHEFLRAMRLEDIRIRAGGDGRTVEAYVATFDDPTEIVDQDGHYLEVNSRAAFDRSIAKHEGRFPVVYHHGLTLAGTPSDRGSVPIGVSTEMRTDQRGVLSVARYHGTDLADEVLEAIRAGAITGQSYGGRYLRSDPELRRGQQYRPAADGTLRTVTRREIALREFGPTPFPAYVGASILGVRAALIADLEAAGVRSPASNVGDEGHPGDGPGHSAEGTPEGTRPPDQFRTPLRMRSRAWRTARGL